MKIITWNCAGKFREKFKQLEAADIYVIQECEDPSRTDNEEYKEFAVNGIWTGNNKNKGLGIFSRGGIKLEDNNWETKGLEHFISCKINDKTDLIGVWACNKYVEEWYEYQQLHTDKFGDNTIIIGDFNSNANFDIKRKNKLHDKFVNELEDIGIVSAYHYSYAEIYGGEKIPTFYHLKKLNRPHHIDYCFTNIKQLKSIDIGNYVKWLTYSDHMPITIEIKED